MNASSEHMHPGQTIQQRYRIDRILGKGSMGTTYKAFDLETRDPVAIKQLHFSRIQDWKVLEMFEREARILQQLEHPRIPAYIDYFTLDTGGGSEPERGAQFVLVQEYIEGKTLQQLVEKGWRGTESEILDIFWQIINILAYLHTLQPPVIHRDINPKNILLSSLNEVFLVDFGAVQERIRTTFLGGSTIVGTYGYVPFEQFSGYTVPASDYYAVGATLLYMLSHRDPADFPTEDLKPQFHESLTVSPRLISLLDGLLESSAKQRVASPDQVRAILEGRPAANASASASAVGSARIPKPPWTKIERIALSEDSVRFRIPKRLMKIIPGQSLLDLTPATVKFLDAYKIGKKLGQSWTLPMASLRPSDVTWHFEHENPVVGINAQDLTHTISSSLALAEVQWLVQELREYIASVQIAALPEATRKMLDASASQTVFLPIAPPEKPDETGIQQTGDGIDHVNFRIPRRILPASVRLKSSFQEELLEFLALFLGKRTIEVSPTWIQVSTRVFGVKLGKTYHIPTTAVRATDINWYFSKMSGSGDSSLQRVVVGLNYGGRTLELASQITKNEAAWLMYELGEYITRYARPTSEEAQSPELDMQ